MTFDKVEVGKVFGLIRTCLIGFGLNKSQVLSSKHIKSLRGLIDEVDRFLIIAIAFQPQGIDFLERKLYTLLEDGKTQIGLKRAQAFHLRLQNLSGQCVLARQIVLRQEVQLLSIYRHLKENTNGNSFSVLGYLVTKDGGVAKSAELLKLFDTSNRCVLVSAVESLRRTGLVRRVRYGYYAATEFGRGVWAIHTSYVSK